MPWPQCGASRVVCASCGKTAQLDMPQARPGSGFAATFEVLASKLCLDLPVRQTAFLLRRGNKQLWLSLAFHFGQTRAFEHFTAVQSGRIHETNLRRGQGCIDVVQDPRIKPLLFANEIRSHAKLMELAADLKTRGDGPAKGRRVCVVIGAAHARIGAQALPNAPRIRWALGADNCKTLSCLRC